MTLTNLSDEALLSSLSSVCLETRRLLGRLLLHLIEVEARRLDLRSACSSLYDFCQRRLGMSESGAVRRIEAARLVRRFPTLLGHIERGELHLTALLLLRDQFTDDNIEELVLTSGLDNSEASPSDGLRTSFLRGFVLSSLKQTDQIGLTGPPS